MIQDGSKAFSLSDSTELYSVDLTSWFGRNAQYETPKTHFIHACDASVLHPQRLNRLWRHLIPHGPYFSSHLLNFWLTFRLPIPELEGKELPSRVCRGLMLYMDPDNSGSFNHIGLANVLTLMEACQVSISISASCRRKKKNDETRELKQAMSSYFRKHSTHTASHQVTRARKS